MEKHYIKDLVSVVINTYNHIGFIESCVKSVTSQSYSNIEIIITDDGSTDGSQDLLKRIEAEDKRIRVLYSERNRGMSANLNKGLVDCLGEYFVLIAGDDQMLPGKIETQLNYLKGNKDIGICWHDMEVFDSDTNAKLFTFNEKYKAPRTFNEHLFYTNWFFCKPDFKVIPSSIMARTSYFMSHLWDERLKYKNELLHGLLIYAEAPDKKIGFIPQTLGRYRVHSNNVSGSEGMRRFGMEEMFIAYYTAAIRFPSIGSKCKKYVDYQLFVNLLYKWIPEDKIRDFEKFYLSHSGVIKFSYLKFCRLLLKVNILFIFFKPFRLIYRLIDR